MATWAKPASMARRIAGGVEHHVKAIGTATRIGVPTVQIVKPEAAFVRIAAARRGVQQMNLCPAQTGEQGAAQPDRPGARDQNPVARLNSPRRTAWAPMARNSTIAAWCRLRPAAWKRLPPARRCGRRCRRRDAPPNLDVQQFGLFAGRRGRCRRKGRG